MDISRKTDYALRMLAMLVHDTGSLLSVRAAALEVNVPYSYARSIQHGLVQAGIIESLRGVHGGMRLLADPKTVTLRQVVDAVEGPLPDADADAQGEGETSPADPSCYYSIWAGTKALICSYLDSVTLDDVVNHRRNPAVDPKFTDRARFEEYAVWDDEAALIGQ